MDYSRNITAINVINVINSEQINKYCIKYIPDLSNLYFTIFHYLYTLFIFTLVTKAMGWKQCYFSIIAIPLLFLLIFCVLF